MPIIYLETQIQAPIEVIFDLARSVELHKYSTAQTEEEAIAGTTSGLMGLGDWVTWRARHFGIFQTLSAKITKYDRPHAFTDIMLKGAFKGFEHEHLFCQEEGYVKMIDTFDYQSPLGIFGKLADVLFLEKYMTDLLEKRNQCIKEFAESGRWREIMDM